MMCATWICPVWCREARKRSQRECPLVPGGPKSSRPGQDALDPIRPATFRAELVEFGPDGRIRSITYVDAKPEKHSDGPSF